MHGFSATLGSGGLDKLSGRWRMCNGIKLLVPGVKSSRQKQQHKYRALVSYESLYVAMGKYQLSW